MESLKLFNYEGNPVSFKTINGKIYANATEMAKLTDRQPSDWIRLKTANEFISSLSVVRGIPRTELLFVLQGGSDQGTWMNEDVAIEFARWLSPKFAIWCNDRIKELAKYGATAINPEDLLNPDFIIRLATELKREREEKEKFQFLSAQQSQQILQLEPKADFFDNVLQSNKVFPISIIAKEMGMNAAALNKLLNLWGVIYKVGGEWVLTAKYENKGYTGTKTFMNKDKEGKEYPVIHTYWTNAGRLFLHELVNKYEIKLLNRIKFVEGVKPVEVN